MQWADLNLGRLLLSFGQRQQALCALHEGVRLAQQSEDHVCLAHAVLWLAHAHEGMGA
jgi:anaphase-promoting complex subunit 5